MFSLLFKPSFEKDLKKIPKHHLRKIVEKMNQLESEPFPYNSMKLSGREGFYRVRVGDYRIVYEMDMDRKTIHVHFARHRSEVYRRM